MKKILLVLLITLFFLIPVTANIVTNTNINLLDEWDVTFGGTHSDTGKCVKQTNNGGYIIVGETRVSSEGNADVWLIKTDENGVKIWDKTFGGAEWDKGQSVDITSDGGYIIAGNTISYASSDPEDVWLIKTDSNGNEIWNRTFGGDKTDNAYSVEQTNDDGYIIIGQTWSFTEAGEMANSWLIKTDSNGNEIWNHTYGGSDPGGAFSGQQTTDGGYIFSGSINPTGGERWIDVYLVKTDENGSEMWSKSYSVTENEVGWGVQQTNDGGYIITGFTGDSSSIYGELLLIKTNANGNKQWQKTFGGDEGETGHSVQQTMDGGYIITGQTYSYSSGSYDSDLWLVRTDSSGNLKWHESFGGENNEIGHYVEQTNDGNYIVVGETFSYGNGINDIWLIKTSGGDAAPNKPNKPSGPTNIESGKTYTYSTSTVDLQDDLIFYKWDWDDSTTSNWLGPYTSSETCEATNSWDNRGIYQVKVKAKDEYGHESIWSDPLSVSMPKSKPYINTLFLNFLEQHPHLFPLRRQLLGL
jgi:hypothetical protein